ncbi:phosphonate metabolism transcriptional regulator PhnF [Ectobacillus antri]|jgi:GntR family transcriptional regulator|uniref:Phosphonate metabolism transcriptional regulator PhnF n=1 Tax=Ectobacillus antri TaxID=2486280 RepID=A0ABT6H196_9BACI|nr:phosphonate metabolism transcriptional regulator PhnF [Ectobacillus antri]MDG4655715.1 phosphonate metabolism transcriptional regulator PhnF [Ectobacillus antri]MDG5752390.1 phosphonate metabolism transcriptional regulator PhnF [Ectobacillus antri]
MSINKYSPFPIYYQIQEWVKNQIESGEWKPGDKIPSEHELCEKFSVSRMTIRQAVNNLVEQGYLLRKRGIGTFVQLPKVEQRLQSMTGFTEDMKMRGMHPSSTLLSFGIVDASAKIAGKLKVAEGTSVYEIRRIRLANQEAIAYETTYLSADVVKDMNERILQHSLYEHLEERLGYKLLRATQTIEASVAGEEEATHLQIAHRAPVLVVEQTSYDEKDLPIEYVKCIYRGDRYKFITTISRQK